MFYDVVFVHAAQMEKRGGEYVFLPEDGSGFLHGEIRIEAAKILMAQGMVRQFVAVGGPTKDGVSKAEMIAVILGGGTIPLKTQPNTQSNISEIKNFLGDTEGVFGLLTNFYHVPRAIRMASEKGVNLIPICAEAVLMAADIGWTEKIKEWYGSDSMLTRILSEVRGLSDLETNAYSNH